MECTRALNQQPDGLLPVGLGSSGGGEERTEGLKCFLFNAASAAERRLAMLPAMPAAGSQTAKQLGLLRALARLHMPLQHLQKREDVTQEAYISALRQRGRT